MKRNRLIIFQSIIILTMLAIILTSCEPAPEDFYEIFKIKEGDHYCDTRHPESLQSNRLSFKAKFDESARYLFKETGFQDSKNKLMGFSDCNSYHHENSARFAWQWYNDRIEIFAYCYVEGVRVEKFLGATSFNETASYALEITTDHYVFYFKGVREEIERKAPCERGVYMILWPYFGGQLPAPHDITIQISRQYN